MDYVFAPITCRSIAAHLTTLIEDYLTTFTELYPECPIIPKQHYLVHIPQWIVKCGPPTRYWCMRFESKNSHFKEIATRIKNFKNIPKSLAFRHQYWSCYINSGSSNIDSDVATGPVKMVEISSLPCGLQLPTVIPNLQDQETISKTSWVKIGGTIYKPQSVVVLSKELELPLFGKIIAIVINVLHEIFFICELFYTECFASYYHAYKVSTNIQPKQIIVCKQSDLADHHIVGLYHSQFMCVKYALVSSHLSF